MVLALLMWRALRWGTSLSLQMSTLCGVILLGCALFAASDEYHQTFVKSRTPSVRDVLLDVGGALLGLLIAASFARRHPKKFRAMPTTRSLMRIIDARMTGEVHKRFSGTTRNSVSAPETFAQS